MRRYQSAIILALALAFSTAALGQPPPPAVIARTGEADAPPAKVFNAVKNYLSDWTSFKIVSANRTHGTIIAQRHGVSAEIWATWTDCGGRPLEMRDTLEASSAALAIKVVGAGANRTKVTVTANFAGTYGIGSKLRTVQC
ncbi:MAG: hypothetical protein ACREP6_07300, partial [Candidatus Binataceae bacterium]